MIPCIAKARSAFLMNYVSRADGYCAPVYIYRDASVVLLLISSSIILESMYYHTEGTT